MRSVPRFLKQTSLLHDSAPRPDTSFPRVASYDAVEYGNKHVSRYAVQSNPIISHHYPIISPRHPSRAITPTGQRHLDAAVSLLRRSPSNKPYTTGIHILGHTTGIGRITHSQSQYNGLIGPARSKPAAQVRFEVQGARICSPSYHHRCLLRCAI